jgi:glycerol-3-phosphate O-acyltransferase/dihydroxyacetone phosphate acyltransferase
VQAVVYFVLVAFLRLVTRVFFRTIEVVGRDHVPVRGPVIFVGNHPNSLVDPVLITTTCGRRVRFAAREGLFAVPFFRPMLWALGTVPIKRRQDQANPEAALDNNAAFAALTEALANGSAFGIFPEGVSYTASELQPMKTGAARIALSSLAEGVPVVIVPCGLSYRRKQRFRSRVLVQYGRALALGDDWKERYAADSRQAARELTDDVELALRALTINAPDFETLRVLDGGRRIYVPDDRDLSLAEEAEITRRLVTHWESKKHLPEIRDFFADIESYLSLLDALGLSDWDLRKPISRFGWSMRVVRHLVLLMFWVPLALPGLVLHLPLIWSVTRAGELFVARDDVRATLRMIVSILGVFLSYAIAGGIVIAIWPSLYGLCLAAVVVFFLALSGLAAIRVLSKQAVVRHGLSVLIHIFSLRGEIARLRKERDALRKRFVAIVETHADPSLERIVTNDELRRST